MGCWNYIVRVHLSHQYFSLADSLTARYYIVTGRYPFEGNTVYTLFENIAKAEYEMPSWLETNQVHQQPSNNYDPKLQLYMYVLIVEWLSVWCVIFFFIIIFFGGSLC